MGNEATETAVKQIQSPRVLHIATHGFFLDQDTFGLESETYEHSLVKSGLALAGANLPSLAAGSDDGLLTALEVTGMDLRATELVVLSSCDSGTGSVTAWPGSARAAARVRTGGRPQPAVDALAGGRRGYGGGDACPSTAA